MRVERGRPLRYRRRHARANRVHAPLRPGEDAAQDRPRHHEARSPNRTYGARRHRRATTGPGAGHEAASDPPDTRARTGVIRTGTL